MKGLEIARRFYEEVGAPLLREQFADLLPYLAVGLMGSGSECDGFDDDISRDHDFEPGFCLLLPGEEVVDRRAAFRLERAYAKLPREYGGLSRSPLSPVGGNRHGVIRTGDFFEQKTGSRDGQLTLGQWFTLPEYALREATNGALFTDPYGEVTRIRETLQYLPEDVRRKKLAGHLLLMGQAGQYNYPRCLHRGDTGAAQLAMVEFVRSALHAIFLLERTYLPYYKWQFHALQELPTLAGLAGHLEHLLSSGNRPEEAADKQAAMEIITAAITAEVAAQGLASQPDTTLERLAYTVNDHIVDPLVRNQHILAGV